MATENDFVNRYEGQGFKRYEGAKDSVELTLEQFKTGGGWYTFPDGEKAQSDEARDYFDKHKGEWA